MAYLGVLGLSGYTSNWWPLGIFIGLIVSIILGYSALDLIDRWEK
jgi:hypothetical protein